MARTPTKAPAEAEPAQPDAAAAAEIAAEAAAEAVEDTEEALASPADTVIDAVTINQQEAMHSMETAGTAMVEGLTRVQREIADFVTERIRRDMETQQALLRCRTLDDVRNVQTEFFRTAMDQYSAEATRLMKLGSEMMARSMDRGQG